MSAIRKLAVAGTGPLAWIAAAGLLRALRHRQVEVWLVDTGGSRDARFGRWTVPSQRGMHALLGVSEPQLVQTTGATFKLASEHHGWQGEGSRLLRHLSRYRVWTARAKATIGRVSAYAASGMPGRA